MVSKIFEALYGVIKVGRITPEAQTETINRIVDQVKAGTINPVEAYVVLDNLKKVADATMKGIKQTTLDYIELEGDNQAFNMELSLSSKKEFDYEKDKEWVRINRELMIHTNAQKARQDFLKGLVHQQVAAGKPTSIPYTQEIIISSKPISN